MPTSPLTAIIVDDEFHARENLQMMLAEFCPQIQVIDSAANIVDAREKIIDKKPQVLFLDIRMPSGSEGFDLLDSLPDKTFQVVFVTAFKHFALKAFNANAIHYILKPIDLEDLIQAVEKIGEYFDSFQSDEQNLEHYLNSVKSLSEAIKNSQRQSRITLYHQKGFRIVNTSEIIRLEGEGNCTSLHFSGGQKYLDTKTLKIFEETLDSDVFMRVHKSHIINFDHLREYSSVDGGMAIMDDGFHIPISRARLPEFLKKAKDI
ncbi:MAG: response regulator [Flavobacteriales bacterium]|nr:response regulator [Flavobacteriales bacterium]